MQTLENPLSFDEMIAEATTRYHNLLNSERRTVADYWEFGRLLNRLRLLHIGRWMEFLDKQEWNYSRVKRAVRIYRRYKCVEDCLNLTLMDGLDYKESEDHLQSEADEQPIALPIVETPSEPGLTVCRGEDDDEDEDIEREEEQDGHEAAADEQPAESLAFSDDELEKARDYILSFKDPHRALAVLEYLVEEISIGDMADKMVYA
jgi:hypothetical protein